MRLILTSPGRWHRYVIQLIVIPPVALENLLLLLRTVVWVFPEQNMTNIEDFLLLIQQVKRDMAAFDADHSKFTQSLGCWSGFHAQQMIKSVRRFKGNSDRGKAGMESNNHTLLIGYVRSVYLYLSGWMVAGVRNRFGHLPDQSMHEKTAVPDLIREMYTSLRQADEVELCDLFDKLKKARDDDLPTEDIIREIDAFQSHVVPIVADIDAGYECRKRVS